MPDLALFQQAFVARLSQAQAATSPMSIYRNTVLLGAVEALGDNFPVIRALLGDDAFAALAAAHAEVAPPASPVLAHYGARFPRWLAEHPIAEELPYLADVAECERLWAEALHATDADPLALAMLEHVTGDDLLRLPLALHPATRIGWHATPAMAIWLAHQDGVAGEIAPDWRPTGALFTRPRLSVSGAEIGAAEHRLLSGIGRGETLGEAAAAAASLAPDADIGSCFAGLVQRGAFAAFTQERSVR
jgi:hypothetical protein